MENRSTGKKNSVGMFFLVLRRDGFFAATRRIRQKLYSEKIRSWVEYQKMRLGAYRDRWKARKVFFGAGLIKKKTREQTDIIICVHNALPDVKRCLDSVLKHDESNQSLIIVDDGSDEETKKYLEEFSERHKARLIRNESALGYTFAANIGLRATSGGYVVLLNSDTVVTSRWVSKMIASGQSDEKIGMVGPLSNTASWQSVPEVLENGDWVKNEIPGGLTVDRWSKLISKNSARSRPEMPILNGFCLMIKRAVLDDLGYFDEENFGRGYGEENDYCLRAGKVGWKMVLADDVFIYHAHSKSYTDQRRKELSERAGQALETKHGRELIDRAVRYCIDNTVLNDIRRRVDIIKKKVIYWG